MKPTCDVYSSRTSRFFGRPQDETIFGRKLCKRFPHLILQTQPYWLDIQHRNSLIDSCYRGLGRQVKSSIMSRLQQFSIEKFGGAFADPLALRMANVAVNVTMSCAKTCTSLYRPGRQEIGCTNYANCLLLAVQRKKKDSKYRMTYRMY